MILAVVALAPTKMLACAACYANGAAINDPMTAGMNWAILTLGVVVATVLGTFMAYFIYIIRKGEAMEAARTKAAAAQAIVKLPPLPADAKEKLKAETPDHEYA
jgi:hypothetical protein